MAAVGYAIQYTTSAGILTYALFRDTKSIPPAITSSVVGAGTLYLGLRYGRFAWIPLGIWCLPAVIMGFGGVIADGLFRH